MVFLSAGWLWLLLPWAALAVWCWRRRPEPRGVTARFLWDNRTSAPAPFAPRRRPPFWVISLLAAMLLGIAAIGGAAHRRRASQVLVLIDPSASLGAVVEGRTLRDEMIDRAARFLPGNAVVERRLIGENSVGGAGYTARPTKPLVRTALDAVLGEFDAVVLVTDKPIRDPRVIVVAPATRPANAGIDRVAIHAGQLMARVTNFGPARAASLRVTNGEIVVERPMQLVAGRQDVFVALSAAADRVDVELVVADDPMPIDNVATLLRTSGWPRLVVSGRLQEAAARFAGVYDRQRPADRKSTDVLLSDGIAAVTTPAVCIADAILGTAGDTPPEHPNDSQAVADPHRQPTVHAARVLVDHPVVGGVDLAGDDFTSLASLPAGAWTVLADVDARPIIAIRELPARQVWIGATLDPAVLGSVVLLNNAVTWAAGDAAPDWSAVTPDAVGVDWSRVDRRSDAIEASHGLYRDGAGRTVAVNVPAVAPGELGGDGSATDIATRPTATSMAGPLAMTAAGLVLLAAWLTRDRGLP